MDDESRNVSLRLWEVLERVGVSERMRQLRRDTLTSWEIQDTISRNITGRPWSVYVSGSTMEGTTTPGMCSDTDMLHCDESRPVIEHIEHAPRGRSLLTVTDSHTRPGYVKLQLVNNGFPYTKHNCKADDPRLGHDNMGRVCYKHGIQQDWIGDRNGPAQTVTFPGSVETDYVYAVRSRIFPRDARKSLIECTRSSWLTRNDAEEMIEWGCLFVSAGHPSSAEKELEWRISFSLQERKLMLKLNPTQHKCYVLLKFIKTMLTSKPDIGKSITSYHCKTCLFNVISKTQSEKWRPENLICCTLECLTELLQCLCKGECPNYFIKENNMFERRVYGDVKERLIQYLREMLNEGFTLFYRIASDNIGDLLRGHVFPYTRMEMNLYNTTCTLYFNACIVPLVMNSLISKYVNHLGKEEATRYLYQQICYMSSVNRITEHTRDETKAAARDLQPILHRLYAAHLASLAFSTDVHESKHRLLQASARNLRSAMTFDLMSSRLLYATILYRQGNNDMCRNLLEQIERNLHETVITICKCYEFKRPYTQNEMQSILSKNPDPQSMRQSSIAACMLFLPSHSEIIPTALQYEMYRSVATPPGSRREPYDEWFDYMAVDSKVYLYFLQYLVYSRLNRHAAKRTATDNILKQLLQDTCLGHRETGYNLLGWIYHQEGQTQAAVNRFLQSWKIRPHHNAAKWHMLILIYRQYAARQ